jgi:Zn-dependent protease
MLGNLSPRQLLIAIPTILIAFTVHELCHAAAALALGDDTAKKDGRITLNPIKHIDPFGFLLLLLAGFGWAKPVVFDREKLSKPVRDEILISLAGPASNLALAFLGALVLRGGISAADPSTYPETLVEVVLTFMAINVGLAVFNLLPIPPLDGSHLYTSVLAEKSARVASFVARYGSMVLIGVILLERVTGADILPLGRLNTLILTRMLSLVGLG